MGQQKRAYIRGAPNCKGKSRKLHEARRGCGEPGAPHAFSRRERLAV
jgi:hypothetical protein